MQVPEHVKLERFMEANGHRDQWLADQIKCGQPQANRIKRGTARPSPDKAFKIEKITKGAVKASALLTGPLVPDWAALAAAEIAPLEELALAAANPLASPQQSEAA